MNDVSSYRNACRKEDAEFIIDKTIKHGNESADIDTYHVGISKLLYEDVVVKIMRKNIKNMQEITVYQLFRDRPHQNIIQTICAFECAENPVRWASRDKPQKVCLPEGDVMVIVLIQEYIKKGDLNNMEWTLPRFVSVFLQLTFTVIEMFEQYNFLYEDWHFGNILVDDTEKVENNYHCLGEDWSVKTQQINPLITDMARSYIFTKNKKMDYTNLATQISMLWDMLLIVCKEELGLPELGAGLYKLALKVGDAKDKNTILQYVRFLYEKLSSFS